MPHFAAGPKHTFRKDYEKSTPNTPDGIPRHYVAVRVPPEQDGLSSPGSSGESFSSGSRVARQANVEHLEPSSRSLCTRRACPWPHRWEREEMIWYEIFHVPSFYLCSEENFLTVIWISLKMYCELEKQISRVRVDTRICPLDCIFLV